MKITVLRDTGADVSMEARDILPKIFDESPAGVVRLCTVGGGKEVTEVTASQGAADCRLRNREGDRICSPYVTPKAYTDGAG